MKTIYEIGSDQSPSDAVVWAVAKGDGRSPLDMDVLAEAINPDGLDKLFDTEKTDGDSPTITFDYAEKEVTVTPAAVLVDG